MNTNYSELNAKYALHGQIELIKEKGDLPVLIITNKFAKAHISLYGAQVLSFIPEGQKEILWMSPKCLYETGKPLRGGIPVCFPWFGPHAHDKSKPMHGFARLMMWNIAETMELSNGTTRVVLELTSNAETLTIWPHQFSAKMIFEIGKKLDVTLCTKNTGNEAFCISDALHTYFRVEDIAFAELTGLKDCSYYAGFSDSALVQIEEVLTILKEENRRYFNHTGDCILTDHKETRRVHISKKGSKVTVVWNPWSETVKNMPDIPAEAYRHFICIEAVNAYTDSIEINPGESHCISSILGVE